MFWSHDYSLKSFMNPIIQPVKTEISVLEYSI